MDIRVVAAPGATTGVLSWDGTEMPCALGRAGIRPDKREGDGATPAGVFALRRLLYRADRLPAPRTFLESAPIHPDDGWCDDPADPRYNRPVRLPYPARHEALWRDDALYDLLVVLGYNDDPPVPGAGSAIFLHVATADYAPTAGCVALAQDDLLTLLTACRPGDRLAISLA
jgi:L,D-peptidoglycan transpeptidase YkuD (ErfK/YbiS/YcfS/YnhG family)